MNQRPSAEFEYHCGVDWLMVLRVTAYPNYSCTIARAAEPPIFISDHYPVVTELLIGE